MLRNLFGCALLLTACAKADTAPSAAASATAPAVPVPTAAAPATAAPTSTAVNASRVQRYPDETGPTQVTTTIVASVAEVRSGPDRSGDVVAGLARGSSVTEVAQHGGSVLVLFADPTDTTRTLEGWVLASTIAAPPGAVVHRTVTPSPSSSAPPPAPAATPTATASAKPAAPAAPTPAHGLPIKVMPVAGKCSASYAFIQAKYCRLSCHANTDCSSTTGATCQKSLCYAPGESP